MTPLFTPKESVIRTLPDGRQIQAATAGVAMSLSDAIYYELLEPADFQGANMPVPANYGTRFRNPPAQGAESVQGSPSPSTLTTTARQTIAGQAKPAQGGAGTITGAGVNVQGAGTQDSGTQDAQGTDRTPSR